MNPVKRFFDSQRKHFTGDGPLARWYPFFESMETVFFAPARVTDQTPHPRDSLDVKRYMATVVFTLLPLLFFGMYNVGYQAYLAAGGHFAAGSMAPKIRACVDYLTSCDGEVLITDPENLERGMAGETGTRITR